MCLYLEDVYILCDMSNITQFLVFKASFNRTKLVFIGFYFILESFWTTEWTSTYYFLLSKQLWNSTQFLWSHPCFILTVCSLALVYCTVKFNLCSGIGLLVLTVKETEVFQREFTLHWFRMFCRKYSRKDVICTEIFLYGGPVGT